MVHGLGGLPPIFDRMSQLVWDFVSGMDPRHQIAEPAQDTNQQAAIHSQDIGNAAVLKTGRIVTAIPYINWYVVNLQGRSNMPCCVLNQHACGPLGVRDAGTIQPGVDVWVITRPHSIYGHIVGVLPPMMTDSTLIFADWTSQGPGCGFQKEQAYNQLQTLLAEAQGSMFNCNGGAPVDGTAAGEWSKVAETGLQFHLDSFMAFMRVSEMCGVWAFYADELLRIAGRNLDLRTAGHEIIARDDEGEFQYLHGDTGYPWEATGSLTYGGSNFTTTADADVMQKLIQAKYEPATQDQMPFYRYQEYGGYLGQGRQRLVVAPPRFTGTWKYSDQDKLQGLFSEHIGYDGSLGVQTAKGFSLVKRPSIVIPKRLRQAEDAQPTSDNATNYKAAGKYGAGPAHKVGDIANVTQYPQIMSVAAVLDLHAYNFAWKRLHPFWYHTQDFSTPDEADLPKMTQQQAFLDFSQLQAQMWLDRPTPKTVVIDSRYGAVQYFQNTAGITVTDDGGVVIFDGYGSAISLTGGNIVIGTAGSLLLQPGKSLVALAGDDVCLRAQNSVDVTAGNKDLRLKAERNMQLLSGNSGQGGLLLENRSQGAQQTYAGLVGEDVQASGIVFKADDSVIATVSASLYLRTTSQDIVLDANQGGNNVISIGQQIISFAQSSILHYFGFDTVDAANIFTVDNTLLAADLELPGELAVGGGAEFGSDVVTLAGFASQDSSFVGKLDQGAVQQIQTSLTQIGTSETQVTQQGQTLHDQNIQTSYYNTGQVGSDEFIDQAQVSLRNEKQYGTQTKFVLPATYWQQLAAEAGAGTAWSEPAVDYQGDPLLPWPGQLNWQENDVFYATGLNLYDLGSGADKGLADPAYQTPTYGPWQMDTPANAYLTLPSS